MTHYEYDPKDYDDSPCLYAEMVDYYSFLEDYRDDKTLGNWYRLDKQRRDLFFSIKHRVVEGRFTEIKAQEMRDYFGELFDTACEYGCPYPPNNNNKQEL